MEILSNGVVDEPGGRRFDVYTIDGTTSSVIRPNKDFSGDPLVESGLNKDDREVILVGGNPDIVPIGSLCTHFGTLFRVWVPNDAAVLSIAKDELDDEHLPEDIFRLDEDNIADAYAPFYTEAKKLDDDEKRIEDGEEPEETQDDVESA